jgi:copper chaperone CopZ
MKKEKLAVGGAVVAAITASLCCVGPVLFALFGLGAFGAAAFFVSARPYLLSGAGLLLAFGFYWVYFRKRPACVPGESCATKPVNRVGRAGLWIASVAVIAFALAPYYIGHVASALSRRPTLETTTPTANQSGPAASQEPQKSVETVTVKIQGMSCTACEVPVRDALAQTPGVRAADVSYERGDAHLQYDPKTTGIEQIKRAIDSTGYKAK